MLIAHELQHNETMAGSCCRWSTLRKLPSPTVSRSADAVAVADGRGRSGRVRDGTPRTGFAYWTTSATRHTVEPRRAYRESVSSNNPVTTR